MKRTLLSASLLCIAGTAAAADWPTSYKFDNGGQLAITGNFAYDQNHFSGDDARFENADDMRRKEFGATYKLDGVFDAMAYYDFQAEVWLDIYMRFQTKAWFGKDYGAIRVGYIKTPVGLDSVGSSRSISFLEAPLATQAIYEGRRTGVEWALTRKTWNLQLQGFAGGTPEGTNHGTTMAGHFTWTPHKAEGDVIHLGVGYSVENPDTTSQRVRAKIEAGLTDTRLIDSGALPGTSHIERGGLEFIRIAGPFTVLAEHLEENVARGDGFDDFHAQGNTVYGSWVVTGESRAYTGTLGNVTPKGPAGALELLLRYSDLDLNDGNIQGGYQHDWTVGANYYFSKHFKVQANYIKASSRRAGVTIEPDAVEMRAQVMF
ncbi:phosphate-selective porin OprO and OprP [Pseudoxanthomonas sp. GM95]|uniref:OprO/OprP family phosphate-selective porin n=1 Tax=Pseudoxanthomonas sp. GM95 TaxID=1881043 RepID=UPI0008CDCEC5|nr:porin [Pseudoxanthomonas sp. GM95]SEK52470.1 phosphate-selective porin OprO and OprP [Pseudoxanthomonas sp. GM95]